ncbi:Mitochondrial amidoxime-reducing component 1 [Eumeta japonica]|uniref:Mitochondrial amidoxime-reducing component 1 n=1 Tax=Eumeta variegata TaxID=151549 RepID=A0A4C1YXL9_EUMVA|nr:Mitochondrial amidoxime-reducing component 1 [Eumeta japonica]
MGKKIQNPYLGCHEVNYDIYATVSSIPAVTSTADPGGHGDHDPLDWVGKSQKRTTAFVWSIPVPVYDCGKEVNEWFTRLFNRTTEGKFRLVYYASEHCRPLSHIDKAFNFEKEDTGALPDECSFHLINDASVDDLNKHLDGKKVSWHNFRPNFLVVGAHPYDEDYWKFIKIGEVVFEVLKPCTRYNPNKCLARLQMWTRSSRRRAVRHPASAVLRCVLTTIDPEIGVRDAKTEPLTTLKSELAVCPKCIFGSLHVLLQAAECPVTYWADISMPLVAIGIVWLYALNA